MKLHSFNKIFKILIDRGACFATKDIYAFSPFLYSVQTQNLMIFFYLIYLGANVHDFDMNGSSIVHWNAYKGNRFLMEVFRSLNLDLFTADNQGYTPLDRALLGISYESFSFLAPLIPPENLPEPNLKAEDGEKYIQSTYIRKLIIQLKTQKRTLLYRFVNWWESKNIVQSETNPMVFVFLVFALSLFMTAFAVIYTER